MKLEKYLSVTATRSPKKSESVRAAEERFADIVSEAISNKGQISNYGVDSEDTATLGFYTLVWLGVDFPQFPGKKYKTQPKKSEDFLRKVAQPIVKALKGYKDVKVVLVTATTTEEVLN